MGNLGRIGVGDCIYRADIFFGAVTVKIPTEKTSGQTPYPVERMRDERPQTRARFD